MASAGVQAISEQPSKLKAPASEGRLTEALTLPSSNVNTGPRFTQPGFVARLHALFPSLYSSSISHNSQILQEPVKSPNVVPPKYIKTRIITWNMHDSLPKGNLEELLGTVPLYTPRTINNDAERLAIPGLSLDDTHPYHILVIAGQECPTLSGIPMGLAANFKHWDPRERDKERHKSDAPEEAESKAKHKHRNPLHRAESLLHKHLKHEHGDDSGEEVVSPTTSGWSAVLEDWYANGIGSLHGLKPVVTATASESPISSRVQTPANGDATNGDLSAASPRPHTKRPGTIDVNWRQESNGKDGITALATHTKKGPYELLIKERLMGIYMAVYVHRDVRPLIRGVSSDTVPAGLIGGRLGNKGGVGISINLNETTLLFVNAHLAAHEGKAQLRVANLTKIKTELGLESFLTADDPRAVSEDLTDKFDYTFIFGDLNFRLDISRLHADWLIAKREYSKALGFDQLKQLMNKRDPMFMNFNEGPIDFPPTFKYDVLRQKKSSKKSRRSSLEEEPEDVESRKSISSRRLEDNEEAVDTASVLSSIRSVGQCRRSASVLTSENSSPEPELISPRKIIPTALFKAKNVWISLVKPISKKQKSSRRTRHRGSSNASTVHLPVACSSVEVNRQAGSLTPVALSAQPQTPSLKEITARVAEEELNESEKGVYDTSSKKRVPSWCDRILWKSTVKPPEDIMLEQGPRGTLRGLRQLQPRRISLPGFKKGGKDEPQQPPSPRRRSFGLFKTTSLESSGPSVSTTKPEEPTTTETSSTLVGGASVRRQRSLPASSAAAPGSRIVSGPRPRRSESDSLQPHQDKPDGLPPNPAPTNALGAPKRWLLSLMSREPSSSSGLNEQLNAPPSPPQPRKGDVVCLSYRTLDDRQMTRLEGRSDHRPVIGSYAMYL